jgi:hypothetical protein
VLVLSPNDTSITMPAVMKEVREPERPTIQVSDAGRQRW